MELPWFTIVNCSNLLAGAFDAEYDDVLFYNSAYWLSHCAVLERFVPLFPHISFFEGFDHPIAKMDRGSGGMSAHLR